MYFNQKSILAADYLRLSREDGDKLESDSIRNQRSLINDFVKQHPLLYHQALQKTNTPHVYYETMGGDPSGSGSGNHEKAVYQHGFYNFMKNIFTKYKNKFKIHIDFS